MLVMEEKKAPTAGEPAAPDAAEPDDASTLPPAQSIETPAERAYREVLQVAEVGPSSATVRNMLGRSFE